MDIEARRDLKLLEAVEQDSRVTQRSLAGRLGIALGLTNIYLKRLARKGYIKITEFPTKPAARNTKNTNHYSSHIRRKRGKR